MKTSSAAPAATLEQALALDAEDPLRGFRDRFSLPPEKIYLMGNSLGLQSRAARRSAQRVLDEWAELGVSGWLGASRPWFSQAERLGEQGAELVGALPEEVVVTGTTTVNIHALVSTFYRPEGRRRKIVADELNFPTDLYALASQVQLRGADPARDLLLVGSEGGHLIDEAAIIAQMTDEVALVFLPSVLYSSGQRLDMERLTEEAHRRGILIGFDLSHSAGVLAHELSAWGVDFALWCSYKYLCGGPGASAFLYVNKRHRTLRPALAGWFGFVKQRQFEMRRTFEPQPGARGFQISSPAILSTAPLEGALELIGQAGIDRIEAKSRLATAYLVSLVDELLTEEPYGFSVATPRDVARRGGHVALIHRREARRIVLALGVRGVIADFRPPELIRLAPAPLYNTFQEIWQAIGHLREIIEQREYERFDQQPPLIP